MAWVEIPLPKTIEYLPIAEVSNPEIALRMKNVYYDGEAVSDVEYYEMVGENNLAQNQDVPFNFVHNLPNRLLRFKDAQNQDQFLIASERSIQNITPTSTTFNSLFTSSSYAQNQFADISSTPPLREDGNATVIGATNWADDKFVYVTSTPDSGLQKGSAIVTPPSSRLYVAGIATPEATIEVRYAYTYYNKTANIESYPSEASTFFIHPNISSNSVRLWGLEKQNSDFPQGVTHIRIYRYTDRINEFIRIAEIEKAVGWKYVDTNPPDVLNTNILDLNKLHLSVTTPTAMAWHTDRMFIGQSNLIRFSNAGSPVYFGTGLTMGGEDATAGGILKLSSRVIKTISWGSYLLILTDTGVLKAFEDNGIMFTTKFDIPIATEAHLFHKVENMLFIVNPEGFFIITPDEKVNTIKLDWRRFFATKFKRKLKRFYPRIRRFYDKKYIEIEFVYENIYNAEWGLEYLRIDTQTGFVSGCHTRDTFLGWGDR